MSSTKLPDASKGLLFVFMRLEGLNQAIEGFQHESLKTPGTSFDQLMTSAWRLPVMPLIEEQGRGNRL